MQIQIVADSRFYEGTPAQIVAALRDNHQRPAPDGQPMSTDAYIAWAVVRTRELLGLRLAVSGSNPYERAESFLGALLRHGLAVRAIGPVHLTRVHGRRRSA